MLLLCPVCHLHYFCLAVPLVAGLLAARWERRPAPTLGPGLAVLFLFCAAVNVGVDRAFYKPLRNSPKLTVIVTAIGVSFVFMNIGSLWKGSSPVDFPDLIPNQDVFSAAGATLKVKDAMVIGVTVPA